MTDRFISYFSMEIALQPGMPTYSGGLGVLAGDTIRSAADMKVPMVAVSLLCRKGYFAQRLDPDGRQREAPVGWNVEKFLREMPARTSVTIEGRNVQLRAWKYEVTGVSGYTIPAYLLAAERHGGRETARVTCSVRFTARNALMLTPTISIRRRACVCSA